MERRISGTTSLYGLIGSPVGHSGSPAMYNYSFQKLGIDSAYLAWDIKENQVGDFIKAVKTLGIKGFNVTMPCKTEVAKQVDVLSPAAQIIGAVNTVVIEDRAVFETGAILEDGVFTEDGEEKNFQDRRSITDTDKVLIGHITDGTGFLLNLQDHGVTIKNKKVVLMGGGGAGTAIFVQAALDGAKEIRVFNRKTSANFAKLKAIKSKLADMGCTCKVAVEDLEDKELLYDTIRESDILINCTNVGMKPRHGESLIEDLSVYRKDLIVAEIIYNPKETKMMADARKMGVETVIGGKGMLLWQGIEAFRLYTGQEMPVEEVKSLFFAG